MSAAETQDQHFLEQLTPEERAGLAGNDADPGTSESLSSIISKPIPGQGGADPSGDDEPEDGDGGDEESDEPREAVAAAAVAAAEAPAPPAAAASSPAAAPAASAAPAGGADTASDVARQDAGAGADDEIPIVEPIRPTYVLPDDFKDRRAKVDAEIKALEKRFDEGDIERDEYRQRSRDLQTAERELDRMETRAQVAEDTAQERELERREKAVETVWQDSKALGIDYEKNAVHYGALQAMMQKVRSDEDPDGKKGFDWCLRRADRLVRDGLGVKAPAAVAPAAVAAPAATRKPSLDSVPKTIANVPGGTSSSDLDGDEFADMDRLTGDAYEEAIAKLGETGRQRLVQSTVRRQTRH